MMADVQWIKIKTDMFDNRKIKYLRKLPEGNNIVLIWVMLLTAAGRCNASGMVFLTENIPYTPKMLADELEFEESTVVLALEALERMDMIARDNGAFYIPGWEEHQNAEALEKLREQNRIRKRNQRQRQQLLLESELNVTKMSRDTNVTNADCHATDKDKEKRIKNKDIIYTSSKEEDSISDTAEDATPKQKPKKEKPTKHKYGEYNNVLLTDEELDKLKTKFTDWQDRIERLSEYMASTGKIYKSHYVTILAWSRRDKEQKSVKASAQKCRSYYTTSEEDDPLKDFNFD